MLALTMHSLRSGRILKICLAALAASLTLAACGGGGSGSGTSTTAASAPSTLDPANMVPASSLFYMSVTLKPQGAAKGDLSEAIDSIAGQGTASRLYAKFEKAAGKKWTEIRSWAGEHIGLALTGFPASGSGGQAFENELVIVVPTNDPAAAERFLTANIHNSSETWNVVGDYVLIGGQSAVGQAEITTPKASLAAQPSYKSDMAELSDDGLFTFYTAPRQLFSAIEPILAATPDVTQSMLTKTMQEYPRGSSLAMGAATLHNEFRIDLIEHGIKSSGGSSVPSGDVSGLPAGSWLALSLGGGLAQSKTVAELSKTLPRSLAEIQGASGTSSAVSAPLNFVEHDLLPALGPMTLSVTGTSKANLQAGLVISPLNKSAGARLASGVKQLVGGLPISASTSGGRVAVTFGYSNLAQLLKPSSTLGQSVGFKAALAQLPTGSKASIYVDFGPLAVLASVAGGGGKQKAEAIKVLKRLNYLIAGGTPGHFRMVLTTN